MEDGMLGLILAAALATGSDARALELMAELKAATGGAALDRPQAFRERGVMVRDGREGTYETFGDLVGMRSTSAQSFGEMSMRGGFDGHSAWHAGPDGKVQASTEEATLKGERLGTYLTVSGYLYPERFPASFHYVGHRDVDGRGYELVAVTPQMAETAELWLDAKSHRLARMKTTDGGVAVEGEVGDWREVDGTWVGHALTIRQGGHEVRLKLTEFRYVPREEARFEAPE
jgi:hypothetical protein